MRPVAGVQPVTTADELFRMADDSFGYELIRGRLRRMGKPGAWHGLVATRLGSSLLRHVEDQELGIVLIAETGFLLDRNPDHVRAPDVAFLCAERVREQGIPRQYWQGAPDLAMEVVSPNDGYSEVQDKACEWLRFGARMVLVVDPDTRRVSVHRSASEVRILSEAEAIDGADVVPGWRLEIRPLFAGV